VFGTIFGVAHGALPDENEVYDPVLHLKEVLMFTHYMPAHWKGRLHSNEVLSEFSAMYQMKVLIFVEEMLSLIIAPWILLRNANTRCERMIDFFREQTVHVDGIGYQCNFAVFGFKKDLNVEDPTTVLNEPDGLRDDYYGLKDDKMAASVQNFMQYYAHYNQRQGTRRTHGWQPPPAWPPLLSQEIITEEDEGAVSTGRTVLSPAQGRNRLDRHQRSPLAARSRGVRERTPTADRSIQNGRPKPDNAGMSESRLMAQDSDLQDADVGGRDLKDDLESDDDGDDGMDVAGKNAGVLGMIYQFSKAKTEKGAGLPI
jgi:autophagy-related protein 9